MTHKVLESVTENLHQRRLVDITTTRSTRLSHRGSQVPSPGPRAGASACV